MSWFTSILNGAKEWVLTRGVKTYSPAMWRHLLTFFAGVLVAAGAPELADQLKQLSPALTSFLTGLSVFLVGLLLSIVEKFGKEKVPLEPKVLK